MAARSPDQEAHQDADQDADGKAHGKAHGQPHGQSHERPDAARLRAGQFRRQVAHPRVLQGQGRPLRARQHQVPAQDEDLGLEVRLLARLHVHGGLRQGPQGPHVQADVKPDGEPVN